jgi:hypothetical protein
MIASTAFQAFGTIQEGRAAKSAANYNAQVAERNAQYADYQAKDATARGAEDERRQRVKTQQMIGTQRAQMAANGMDLSDGDGLNIQTQTAQQGTVDALIIRQNAEREAFGYKTNSYNFRAEAGMQRAAGKNAVRSSYISALGTTLSGGSKAAGMMG